MFSFLSNIHSFFNKFISFFIFKHQNNYFFVDALIDVIFIFLLFLFNIFSLKWAIGAPFDFLGLISAGNEKMFLINNILLEILGISFFILFSILFFLIYCLEVFEPRAFHMPSFRFSEDEENFLDALFILIPSFFVYCILLPTLGFLFKFDLLDSPNAMPYLFEIGVTGHQWYWEYTYYLNAFIPIIAPFVPENELGMWNFSFDSYMIKGPVYRDVYLLAVDKPLVIPVKYPVLLTITSADVIHSFAVPALGIKVDAIPGKITHDILQADFCHVYFGQCSELCGSLHGYMPIQIEVIPVEQWVTWISLNSNYMFNSF